MMLNVPTSTCNVGSVGNLILRAMYITGDTPQAGCTSQPVAAHSRLRLTAGRGIRGSRLTAGCGSQPVAAHSRLRLTAGRGSAPVAAHSRFRLTADCGPQPTAAQSRLGLTAGYGSLAAGVCHIFSQREYYFDLNCLYN